MSDNNVIHIKEVRFINPPPIERSFEITIFPSGESTTRETTPAISKEMEACYQKKIEELTRELEEGELL